MYSAGMFDFQFGFSFEDDIPLLHSIHRVFQCPYAKKRTHSASSNDVIVYILQKGRGSFAKGHFHVAVEEVRHLWLNYS